MWTDTLTTTEAEYTRQVLEELSRVAWAGSLLAKIEAAGGLTAAAMPLLFEVRVAYELYRTGCHVQYEYPSGVGDSTVDFRVVGSREWLIELVSIRESNAVKRATVEVAENEWQRELATDAADRAQSEEGELITAEQKIVEKVYSAGTPTKFPLPSNAYHVILTDMRGYLGAGGDRGDYRHIAYGAAGVRHDPMLIHWWTGTDGKRRPIKGLFEASNPLKGAAYVRERIHVLGFIKEKDYHLGEIRQQTYYVPNNHLFNNEEIAEARSTYPLRGEETPEAKVDVR